MKKIFSSLILLLLTLSASAQWGYPTYDDLFQQYFGPTQSSRKSTKKKEPIEEQIKHESNGFVWIKLSQYDPETRDCYYGAKDESGKTIIPLSRKYTYIYFNDEEGVIGYFSVKNKSGHRGACSIYGATILSPKEIYDSILFHGGKFHYKKKGSSEFHETNLGLSSTGKITGRSNSGSTSADYYYAPAYSNSGFGYSGNAEPSGNGTVHGTNPQNTLNQTQGEACKTCEGSGKCPTCNGTKVASSLGNTYACKVCLYDGSCPSCGGSGKAGWNHFNLR